MNPVKDLTGFKFHLLYVVGRAPDKVNRAGRAVWLCLCDCGNEKEITANNLVTNNSKSCGCLRRRKGIKRQGL